MEPVEKIVPEHTLPIIQQLNRRVRKKTNQARECTIEEMIELNALYRLAREIEKEDIRTDAVAKFINTIRDACKLDTFLYDSDGGKHIFAILPRDIRVKLRRQVVLELK